jgi:hypothetical protein
MEKSFGYGDPKLEFSVRRGKRKEKGRGKERKATTAQLRLGRL